MSKTFIKDPREVVKPGDIVKVKVLEVDVPRKRIALTLRLDDEVGAKSDRPDRNAPASRGPMRSSAPAPKSQSGKPAGGGTFAEAFARATEKAPGGKPGRR
jgi:uncharacterized protein